MTIRTESRAKNRPGDETVYGDDTDRYPLGLLRKLALSPGWAFFPYQGFGKEIEKPTREAVLESVERRWNRHPGNPAGAAAKPTGPAGPAKRPAPGAEAATNTPRGRP